MSYYAAGTYAALNTDPATVMQSLYTNYGAGFKTDCQRGLHGSGTITPSSPFATMTDEQIKLAQATVCAFGMKPYGGDSGWTLEEICAASSISCAQYVKLALELYNKISSYALNCKKDFNESTQAFDAHVGYDAAKPVVWAFGFNAGAVGNHAQLLMFDPANLSYPWMLCDPTCGLIAMGASIDTISGHAGLADKNIVDFWVGWEDARQAAAGISSFITTVRNAIKACSYKASDQIYCHPGLENFRMTMPGEWFAYQAWLI